MGNPSSKTAETSQSSSSSSVYGRSSSSYERTQRNYAPSAPPLNTIYSSSDYPLRSRATEQSYSTHRNAFVGPNSYNSSRSSTASTSVSKPPSSATVASSHLSSSTTACKPSSTAVANNRLSSTTTTTTTRLSSATVANNQFSSTTTGSVASNHLSSSTTARKPSSTAVANNQLPSTTTTTRPSSTIVANNQFSSTSSGPKPSSMAVVNNHFSSTSTAPKPLYPTLNEFNSSLSVPSHTVIYPTTVVSTPLLPKPPTSSHGPQTYKKQEPEVTPSNQITEGNSNHQFKAAYKKRNDCKFYYYTKCSKGDRCDFRHEPAALGSKRVCCMWKQGKCFDEHCQFRHMNLENNTNPCYWEEKRGSCTVKECPFQHLKLGDKQDNNDTSKAKDKKENNENKPKVYNRRRRLRRGPLGSTSDISQVDEDEFGDSSVTQEKEGGVSLLELLQKLKEAEQILEGGRQASSMASEPGQKSGNKGDPKLNDCKYFYYSKCSKGDKCIYRHDPASVGCKTVCFDWELGKCNRYRCKFRHMILENNPMKCCWENKAGGCQVEDCPFQHMRSKDDFEGNNEENDEDCSNVKAGNKGGNNAGNRNKNRKPKHQGGKRNRSAGRLQADKKKQSTDRLQADKEKQSTDRLQADKEKQSTDHLQADKENPTIAAQGLSAELLRQIELHVKEVQKKLEEERANAMKKVEEEQEKLADMKLREKTKEMIEKMEGVLNCSICFELFVSPITLNCSHTFCQFCIKEWRKYEMNCPLCREYITSEARALNIDNLIEEMMPDFSQEMKEKRENVIKLREIHASLP